MKVTLKRVEQKAIKEPAFWKKLLEEPDQALRDNKMELTAKDYRHLEAILGLDGTTITVDLRAFMVRARRRSPSDILFWRGIWAPPGLPSDRGRPAKTR